MENGQVFLVGLDCADPDLLERWIGDGSLPFFEQLMQEGAYCRTACIPPVFSPVEWTSILTGTNPGKHAILGFERPVDGGRRIKVYNRTDRKCDTFYKILSRAGEKVGLINMVMTYPATPMDGFTITGMETPDLSSPGSAYPPDLIEELRSAGIVYQIDSGIAGLVMDGRIQEAAEAVLTAIEERYKATRYLMARYDCDLLIVLFSQIDNCSHYFWRFCDESDPAYSQEDADKYGDVLLRVYQKCEWVLQDLISAYPGATFVICSDHGIGPNYEARYYLRTLFSKLGWYCPVSQTSTRLSPSAWLATITKGIYWYLFRRVPIHYKRKIASLFPALRERVEGIVSDIDWDRTRIYSNDEFFSISINRDGKDGALSSERAYLDFREKVIAKLYALQELDTGKPLVDRVYTREELYSGPHVQEAPDLIIEWAEVRLTRGIQCEGIAIHSHEIQKSALQRVLSGEHRPEGILLMRGDMIQANVRPQNVSIMDIAPTILHICGHPVPRAMDGKVLFGAFRQSFRAKHPVEYADEALRVEGDDRFDYTNEDATKVRERLRQLGYID